MKVNVVVLSESKKAGQIIKEQLQVILGENVTIDAYSKEEEPNCKISCDLCLAPSEDISNTITNLLLPNTKIIPVRRTLLKSEWEKVMALPYGTKALLVNTSKAFAEETIAMLLKMGANHVEYLPYYPNYPKGAPPIDDIKIAITPDELEMVPEGIEDILNIKTRVIDLTTLLDIVSALDLLHTGTKQRILAYANDVLLENQLIFTMIDDVSCEKDFANELLHLTGYLMIVHDKAGKIVYCNKNIPELSKGRPIDEYFEDQKFCKMEDLKEELTQFKCREYLIGKKILYQGGASFAGVLALKDVSAIKRQLDKDEKKSGFVQKAKYTFEDILGNSKEIRKTIELAARAAKTDLDILLEGETGTGKELFANAIHNASKRSGGPFVAINCTAISSSLLESEFFGYEDGAFTGAKKGGKRGLLEAADKGTVFLDEIGEISKEVQVKLLRVLQEREVTRVGGVNRIPIDIRVISATNQNLYELASEGKFRLDLYYRLNVLPIRIPPLRERKEDFLYLIQSILKNKDKTYMIPQDVIDVFEHYSWPGNLREFKNCCDYAVHMNGGFTAEGLPEYLKMGERKPIWEKQYPKELGDGNQKIKYEALKVIGQYNQEGKKIGRRTIVAELEKRGLGWSEQEVRQVLVELGALHLITACRGRAGSKITEEGRALLNRLL